MSDVRDFSDGRRIQKKLKKVYEKNKETNTDTVHRIGKKRYITRNIKSNKKSIFSAVVIVFAIVIFSGAFQNSTSSLGIKNIYLHGPMKANAVDDPMQEKSISEWMNKSDSKTNICQSNTSVETEDVKKYLDDSKLLLIKLAKLKDDLAKKQVHGNSEEIVSYNALSTEARELSSFYNQNIVKCFSNSNHDLAIEVSKRAKAISIALKDLRVSLQLKQ
jgi:hypothetical protein